MDFLWDLVGLVAGDIAKPLIEGHPVGGSDIDDIVGGAAGIGVAAGAKRLLREPEARSAPTATPDARVDARSQPGREPTGLRQDSTAGTVPAAAVERLREDNLALARGLVELNEASTGG
jgi:hypothetical protein